MLLLCLLTTLLFSAAGLAQDSTKVRFYVKGSSDFWIKLDGELLPLSNIQMISRGTHDIEIWSPMHLKYIGEITVLAADSMSFYQELKKDQEYIAYLFEMDKYKRKVFLGRTAPLFAAFAGAVAAPIFFFARKNWHEKTVIEDFKFEYFSSNASGADNIRARYQTTNALFFTSLGMVAGGLTSYALLQRWVKNLKKPVYRQLNPFTVETFEIGFHPVTGTPQVGLTLNF